MAADSPRPFRVGGWTVHASLDQVSRDGTVVKLEPRTMRLLCCLAERPGEVFSTEELLDRVWSGVVVGQASVYQAVAQLRRALDDAGPTPRLIATVPRKGYRLIAPVTLLDESPSDAAGRPAPESGPARAPDPPAEHSAATPVGLGDASPMDAASAAPGARTRGGVAIPRGAGLLLAASVAVVLIAIGGWFAWRDARTDADAPALAVAVLPFADLSADGDQRVFVDGLTDELINSLARVDGLRVTGRTSAFRLRDDPRDTQEIGAMLGVTHVLEGSVRSADGRLRINAQLVSTKDGFQVWANTYDRPRAGAIALQTEIARSVADALQVQLSSATRERLARGPTSQLNAYDLYLLGRYHQLQRKPDSLERAVQYHRQAIEADPRFALARAGLADALMAGHYYANRPIEETARLVEPEVTAALELDPELPEAYAARAVLRTEQWRLDEAIADLQRAIAINPNAGEFQLRLGAAYEYAGRPRDALAAYDEVLTLDPLHTVLHVRRCLALQNLGRHDEAERACDRGFELQPDIPNALWAHGLNRFAQGRTADAIRFHGQALERAPRRSDIRAERALLLLDAGDVDAARREIAAGREQGAGGADYELRALYVLVAAGEMEALARAVRDAPWLADASPDVLVEAAGLALLAGDAANAQALRRRAQAHDGFEDAIRPGIYKVRWGRCELCTLSLLEREAGELVAADRHAATALDHLDRLASAGHRWHGLEYVRATVHAAQGRNDEALDALDRAARLGWRRGWLTRIDPAFRSLRDRPQFAALVRATTTPAPRTAQPARQPDPFP